ncbi:MAG: choice-of-anchor L domain-containing protein [Crocinitomicaceae bacterium]
MFKYLFHIALFLLSADSFGQLVTSTAQSPAQLVQNVLLGPGVTVSNITFTGSGAAIGSFTAIGTNLGINSGIVLTTGTVINTGQGPQGPNNKPNAGINNGSGGSALLNGVLGAGNQTFNASILEFDFVPYSDTVRFKYVFGSEEYPEFVGLPYNDIFGFFISGPGIIGQQNIAKIPGNGGIISINNVNDGPNNNGSCSNCGYYTNNGIGNNAPYSTSTNYIQYDGFTVPLEAVSRVQCGQTYHLIIAIADVEDAIYDSGIFLQANSLTSKTPVEVTYTMTQQAFTDPKIMAEGCVTTTVKLTRQGNISGSLNIPLTVTGTATPGLDFSPIPGSVTFAPGQATTQFTFSAFTDAIVEGIETVILNFLMTDPCGNQTPLVVNLGIDDVQPVALILNDTTVLCSGDDVVIPSFPSGGVGPYTYLWSTGESTNSITVSPISTTNYSLTVTDNCLLQSATENVTVTVPVYSPISLTITPDITEICPYLKDTLKVVATGGTGIYTYQWTKVGGSGSVLGSGSSLYIQPNQTTVYRVIVRDQCTMIDSAFVTYTILSPPLLITMSPDIEICPGDEAYLSVSATGGFGAYYYSWIETGETTPNITVNPFNTTTYTVHVSDDCQTFYVAGSTKVVVVKPNAQFQISSHTVMQGLPITFQNLTLNAVTYLWDFGDGQTSTLVHPNNTYAEPGYYDVWLVATDAKGCVDSIKLGVQIQQEVYFYVPNAFTPDADEFNPVFKISSIGLIDFNIKIFNRWGEMIFEAYDPDFTWDGTYSNNEICPDGVYTYVVKYSTPYEIDTSKVGHVNLIR